MNLFLVNKKVLLPFLASLILLVSSCDKRTFKTEQRPIRPSTQIRFVNLSTKEKVRIRWVTQDGTESRGETISLELDSINNLSDYIKVTPDVLQRIELFKSDGSRVPYDGPLDYVERADPRLNQDTSLFAFLPNNGYTFYILPEEARKAVLRNNGSLREYGIAFQVVTDEIEKAFPQKAKVRFINFTSSRGRGLINVFGQAADYDSQNPLPNVTTPRMYSCNPTNLDPETGNLSVNTQCEFKTITEPIGIEIPIRDDLGRIRGNIFNNNLFTGTLRDAMKTYSNYQLLNDGLQDIYLALGEVNAAVATFRYPLNLKSGGVYSVILTGEVNFNRPDLNFGLTLRLFEEGASQPSLTIQPLPGGDNSFLRFINVSTSPSSKILLNVNLPVNAGTIAFSSSPFPTNLVAPSQSAYNAILVPGFYNIRAIGVEPTPVYYETNFEVPSRKFYTLFGAPTISQNVIDGWILEDDRTSPSRNKVKLRFVNLALNAPAVDMKIGGLDGESLNEGVSFRNTGSYVELQLVDEISNTNIPYNFYFTRAGTNESIFLANPLTGIVNPIIPNLKVGTVVTVLLSGNAASPRISFIE